MSDHSARPRIESVGTFVLTVDEPPVEEAECPTYDEDIGPPTYTLIGDASGTGDGDWTLTLDSDALVMEDGGDSYVLAVVILSQGATDDSGLVTVLNHGDTFTASDDSAEPVPDYLKLDGFDCFNPAWRHKTLFDGSPHSNEFDSCDGDDNNHIFYNWAGHVAFRAMSNPLPAGTTITVNMGHTSTYPSAGIAWQMQAILIKNMAPYTSITHGGGDTVSAFDEGGALFTFAVGGNEVPGRGSCGIFIGTEAEGDARRSGEGDSIVEAAESVFVQNWHGDGGPSGLDCDCEDNTATTLAEIRLTMIPAGGGTYDLNVGTLLLGFAEDTISCLMLPGQGFY